MIKKVLLTAALLAPGLAYGQVSAPLDPPVVPAGSAPVAPAPAQAAGFTTCVMCIDFTAPTGGVWTSNGTGAAAYQPAGVNASQPSTWLDCAGANSPLWYHGTNNVRTDPTCPSIVTDNTISPGLQVLKIMVQQNQSCTSPPCPNSGNTYTDYHNGIKLYKNNCCGIAAPTGFYAEGEMVIVQFPNANGNSKGYSNWIWAGGGGEVPNYNNLEMDAFEVNGYAAPSFPAPTFAAGVSSYIQGFNVLGSNWFGQLPPNYTRMRSPRTTRRRAGRKTATFNFVSEYLTVGHRATTDGNSRLYRCEWIGTGGVAGTLQNCVNFTTNGTTFRSSQLGDATSRMQQYLHPVVTTDTGGGIGPMIAYVKRFDLWACPNWATTACSTPGNPDPGGY
jgi:hypothetical protein